MPGPFDIAQPWEPVPSGPFEDLTDIEPPVFDPSAFPTEESIIAEMEAEQQASAPMQAPEVVAMPSPSWADAQLSPEAEAELSGAPAPSPEYSADLSQRVDGFEGQAPQAPPALGADIGLDPTGVINPSSTPLTEDELEAVPGTEAVPVQDLSNEALAMRQFEQNQAAEQFRRDRQNEEAAEAAETKLRNAEVYETSLAKANERTERILQRSEEIGRQTVDNDRWFDSRSTAGKIGVAISILADGQLGILSGRGGNEAMDLFQSMINQDIETQKFNIQKGIQDLNRDKGLVATLYEQTGDIHEAAETARLASYEAGLAKIDSEMAKLDPEGTQAVAMEVKRRQVRGQIDSQRAAVAAEQRKNAMAEAKLNVEIMDKESAMAKRQAEIRKLDAEAAKANRRGGGKKKDDVYPREYFAQVYGVDVPYPMSLKDFDDYNKRRKTVGDLNGSQDPKEAADTTRAIAEAEKAKRDLEADSNAVNDPTTGNPMMLANGKVWRHAKASEAADIMEVTQNITRASDEIARLRAKSGGNWASLKSADWQKIQALTRQIDFENAVALKLGALSEGDLKELVAFRGGVDPNSQVFDALAGIEQMGKSVVDKANTRMRKLGWTGDRWEPGRKASAKSREKARGEVAKDITSTASFEFKTPDEVFEDRKEQIGVFLEKDPSIEEMRALANDLGNLKAREGRQGVAGEPMLTQDQVYELAGQMRERYESLANEGEYGSSAKYKDAMGLGLMSDEDFFNSMMRGE